MFCMRQYTLNQCQHQEAVGLHIEKTINQQKTQYLSFRIAPRTLECWQFIEGASHLIAQSKCVQCITDSVLRIDPNDDVSETDRQIAERLDKSKNLS